MDKEPLASRRFDQSDQLHFADLSGDRNPMHLDAVFARRTQAGGCAVHGMHLLLWAMDAFARGRGDLPAARGVRARFSHFVLVGEAVRLRLAEYSDRRARLAVTVNEVTAAQIFIDFGRGDRSAPSLEPPCAAVTIPQVARDMTFEDMLSCGGTLAFARPAAALAAEFPAVAGWIGSERAAAIAASSCVVGMLCPGLHSIYASIAADFVSASDAREQMEFRVASSDERFRLIRISMAGGGIAGTIESMARIPPVAQETMLSLAGAVGPTEFRGSTALIIGGSRGLGELVAKLVATGGGKVIITHRVGSGDAEKVMDEINAAGGDCACIKYDVLRPAAEQLADLADIPTHLYYFATPVIYRQQAESYSPTRFREFLDFYVDGLWNLIQCLHDRNRALSAFYPSTVFVAERPHGMTEYAMAKSAGEILCAEINAALAPLHILASRLPRLATDQTASNLPVETQPALRTLLPLVREVQAWPRGQ